MLSSSFHVAAPAAARGRPIVMLPRIATTRLFPTQQQRCDVGTRRHSSGTATRVDSKLHQSIGLTAAASTVVDEHKHHHHPPIGLTAPPHTEIPKVVVERHVHPITYNSEGVIREDGTIFRRPLPAPAVELSSDQGVELFSLALKDGTARCFFRLMEQLHTQNEPEYCGLATLVTVLNALGVDPHRRWKGPWRFFSEEILDCCEPVSNYKTGIMFDKLAALARCNGLTVNAHLASNETEESFRNTVRIHSQRADSSLVLAYNRKILGQTGTGHYSPLGAFHEASDNVLILDVARFKYRPHWVPISMMFKAMLELDPDTGRSRGFLEMRPDYLHPPPSAAQLVDIMPVSSPPLTLSQLCLAVPMDGQNIICAIADVLAQHFSAGMAKLDPARICSSTTRRARIQTQLCKTVAFDVLKTCSSSNATVSVESRALLLLSLDPRAWSVILSTAKVNSLSTRQLVKSIADLSTLGEDLKSEIAVSRSQMTKWLGVGDHVVS